MKYIYFGLIVQLIFSSCSETELNLVQVMPEESLEIELRVDTLEIETPQTNREFPYRFPSFDYGNQVFAGLDERTNTINVYDLTSFKIKHSIELHNQGPHAIQGNMVGSIWYQSPDSIFVLQHVPNRLMIVNSAAEIIWQKDLTEAFKDSQEMTGLMAYSLFDRVMMYYRNGKAYFGLRQNQAHQDFLNPMIGYYDFAQNEMGALNIPYPEFYTRNENVGSYQFPGITWFENSILIVFPYSPEIFVYDLKGHLLTHVLKPDGFKMGKAPEPDQSNRSHLLSNPLYRGVIPVGGGQYYVQYSQEQTPLDAAGESYQATIVYSRDFKEYQVIDKNLAPVSFGGEYFYYPLLPEQTNVQLLERYRIEVE